MNEGSLQLALVAVVLSILLTALNKDVSSYPKDIYTSIDLCRTHQGLSSYSKDNGGDFDVYCLDGSEYHNPKAVEHEH